MATGQTKWEKPTEPSTPVATTTTENPWEERTDESSGRAYYYNTKTGAAEWEKPAEYDALVAANAASLTTQNMPEPQTPQGEPPSVWEEKTDPSSGATYYFNTETQISVWERPAEMDQQQTFFPNDREVETPPLPEEDEAPEPSTPWEAKTDPASGATYYFNSETHESVWEKPQELTDYEEKMAAKAAQADVTPRKPAFLGSILSFGADKARNKKTKKIPRQRKYEEKIDPSSGATYFFNTHTQESAWEKPADFDEDAALGDFEEVTDDESNDEEEEQLTDDDVGKEEEQHTPDTSAEQHTDESVEQHTDDEDEDDEDKYEDKSQQQVQLSFDLNKPREHLHFAPFGMFVTVKQVSVSESRSDELLVTSPLTALNPLRTPVAVLDAVGEAMGLHPCRGLFALHRVRVHRDHLP